VLASGNLIHRLALDPSGYAVRPFICYTGEIFQLAPPRSEVPQVASRLLRLRGKLETRYLEAAKERQAP
jgi:hypothetical protein